MWNALIRWIRRRLLRLQLRSLDDQMACIVDARHEALKRLMEVRRERNIKEIELWLHDSAPGAA